MLKTIHRWGSLALVLMGVSMAWAQTSDVSEEGAVPSEAKKKELPFVDLYVVPIGPVPLARFGQVKEKPVQKKEKGSAPGVEGSESSDGGKTPEGEKAVPVAGPKGFVVLQRDAREYPPKALYLKQGDKYAVLPCPQNSIGSPIRVPLKGENLVFYTRKMGSEGKFIYEQYHRHRWNPGQKRLLVTITKPLKSKYWTKPQINTYDVSPEKIKGKSLVVVNAGREREVGMLIGGEAKRLKPYGKASMNSGDKVSQLKLGVLTKSNKLHAPQHISIPNRPNEQMLILAFPCSTQESFRGIKMIRGRIIPNQFRKVDVMEG